MRKEALGWVGGGCIRERDLLPRPGLGFCTRQSGTAPSLVSGSSLLCCDDRVI